jgi:predicted nucleic acid-binding protein
MKVVLDTNAIFGDFNFKKPIVTILLEELKQGKLRLFIPEVVQEEVINQFRQGLEKAQNNIQSGLRAIRELTTEPMESLLATDFIPTELDNYRKRLAALFSEYGIEAIPIPQTNHHFLVQKAMLKKKPFNASEKGYRDSLIWENIKSLISAEDEEIASSPELVFITDNHTDFLSGDQLHEDLIAELEQQALQTESIKVFRNLKDFTDNMVELYEVQADIFKDRINNDVFWNFELKAIITSYLDKEYVDHKVGDFEFIYPGDYMDDEREITAYHDDFTLQDLAVKKLNAEEFVVELRIDVLTELEFFIDKSDYYSSRDNDYHIIEGDWNRHVMLVGGTDTLSFDVTLIINSKLECQSIEMNKIDES